MNLGNPIKKINNVDVSAIPSTFKRTENDVSAPNSGRTQDGVMHKQMIGESGTFSVTFRNVPGEKLHTILNEIDHEYASISAIDMKDGTEENGYVVTREYYFGDRSYDLYNASLDRWTLSFNVIERGIH